MVFKDQIIPIFSVFIISPNEGYAITLTTMKFGITYFFFATVWCYNPELLVPIKGRYDVGLFGITIFFSYRVFTIGQIYI